MYLLILLGVAAVVVAALAPFFIVRRLSPIPYFPSNGQDIPLILDQLPLENGVTLYDLGAGDGVVIFKAAQRALELGRDTEFVACELNPVLLAMMHIRRLMHRNHRRISIIRADIFTANYQLPKGKRQTVNRKPAFFTYISPWYMEKTVANVTRQLRGGATVDWISYFYPAPRSKKYTVKQVAHTKNIHDVYRYTITARG